MPNGINDVLFKRQRGLPDLTKNISPTSVSGISKVPLTEKEKEAAGLKRTASLAGVRTPTGEKPTEIIAGLPEIEPTLTFEEARKKVSQIWKGSATTEAAIPTEEYVPAPGGISRPVGYPEEGKVYTEADLGQPMTQGGFGYVPRGLPEAGATAKDYYREAITRLNDRADKLVLDIESGFATGKRLTAAAEELRNIQNTMPLLMQGSLESELAPELRKTTLAKMEAETEKLKKEAAGLPSTFKETKELAESKTTGDVTSTMTNVRAYQKELAEIERDNTYYPTPESKAEAKRAVNKRWATIIPGYIIEEDGVGGLPQSMKFTYGGVEYRRTPTGWQRWEE